MKVFTSYFYNIRFFKPWQIPLSTAVWDPKWFHAFKDQSYKFIDKNGVINGLRISVLAPDQSCRDKCRGNCEDPNPLVCDFIKSYKKQLQSLDKNKLMLQLSMLEKRLCSQFSNGHEIEFIMIVHEAPTKTCSERASIQELFNCGELEIR